MAGTLLHITLADQLIARIGELHPALGGKYRHDYRLGSVLVDLPYFDRLWLSGIKSVLGRPLSFNEWGTVIHRRSPTGLALALLDGAEGNPARAALALGALTHHAVDLTFHPHIKAEVDATTDDPARKDSVHKDIEDQFDLHCHYYLLGHTGVGTPYVARTMFIMPCRTWTGDVRSAIAGVHGSSPSALRLERWLMNLRLFGVASASGHPPWVSTTPRSRDLYRDISVELAEKALETSEMYVRAGLSLMDRSMTSAQFRKAVPDLSMLDGGPCVAAVAGPYRER